MERTGISGKMMNTHSVDYLELARGWAGTLEDREAIKTGATLKKARTRVARGARVSPGTLENLRNGRLKSVTVNVFQAIHSYWIEYLNEEIARAEHELQIARAVGVDPRCAEMAKAEAALADARALLSRKG